MLRRQAYKFELLPSGAQKRQMRRYAGLCRFVYNKALAWQKEQYAQDPATKFNANRLINFLPAWKKEFPWLKEAPSQTLQQAIKNLEKAYQNFFSQRAQFPRFKKKHQQDSFRFPAGFELRPAENRLRLPKLGWMRYRNSREVLGTVKNITISQSCGKWYASIQTEREVEVQIPTSQSVVGIDVGIARFATLSDGSFLAPLNSFKKHELRLRRYQRRMSRKTKFSQNWKKAKVRVQKIHARIANCRRDFLHQATTTMSQNHSIVCIEDLPVRNMSKSAAGNTEQPGKKVRAKSGLNKAILDQGWFEFRRQLDYKLAWHGGFLIAVPPKNTSRKCPHCGYISAENRKTQAQFKCMVCRYENNADVVGAINIKERGLRLLACGEITLSGYSVKQEPTEANVSHFRLAAVGIPAI